MTAAHQVNSELYWPGPTEFQAGPVATTDRDGVWSDGSRVHVSSSQHAGQDGRRPAVVTMP